MMSLIVDASESNGGRFNNPSTVAFQKDLLFHCHNVKDENYNKNRNSTNLYVPVFPTIQNDNQRTKKFHIICSYMAK